jgi:hypothetical protein
MLLPGHCFPAGSANPFDGWNSFGYVSAVHRIRLPKRSQDRRMHLRGFGCAECLRGPECRAEPDAELQVRGRLARLDQYQFEGLLCVESSERTQEAVDGFALCARHQEVVATSS